MDRFTVNIYIPLLPTKIPLIVIRVHAAAVVPKQIPAYTVKTAAQYRHQNAPAHANAPLQDQQTYCLPTRTARMGHVGVVDRRRKCHLLHATPMATTPRALAPL